MAVGLCDNRILCGSLRFAQTFAGTGGTYTAEACFQDLRRKLGRERRQVRQQFR